MKIAILGTRGIPNNYGGFEQFAEHLGVGLVNKGHDVTVYNSSNHYFKNLEYKGIKITHKYCPEAKIGPFANFYYDWVCSRDAHKKDYDIVYHAGYQSSAPGIWFFSSRSKSVWVTNMDGLEWKRDKWSKPVKWLTKIMERITIKHTDYIIADNIGIQDYYRDEHNVQAVFLPYGAHVKTGKEAKKEDLDVYNLTVYNYFLMVARLEPENNIEVVLQGYLKSKTNVPIIIVGDYKTKYGRRIRKTYSTNSKIRFLDGIYGQEKLDLLRKYTKIYFHGHSVGGTNPSLLEAMASGRPIVAYENIFNKSVLQENGLYFSSESEIQNAIAFFSEESFVQKVNGAKKVIEEKYSWKKIVDLHIEFFEKAKKAK